MKIIKAEELTLEFFNNSEMESIESVREIIRVVKEKGDSAIKDYTLKFDKIEINSFQLTKNNIQEAYLKIDSETIEALKSAANNIRRFAENQMKDLKDFEVNENGVILGQRIIPAKVAGAKEIIVCSPKINPVTVVAADIAGADKIFSIGGVQAIAGMAYGTESIPKVDKIVGPGNQYVAAAKKEVYGTVGIDFIAGPSEVFVIADETGNPKFIAADLLAQAEHDPTARAEVVTTSEKLAKEIVVEIEKQLNTLKTKDVAELSIKNNGAIIIVKNISEAVELANKRAPEHLELQIRNPDAIIPRLKNYGSLFIGEYSAEVFGDYCSGPNHTLPTNGCARYTGGLSVKEYVKVLTYQKVTKEASSELIRVASKLAEVEGLYGHKNAADIRK